MELKITADFAKQLISRSKKDAKLAGEVARQFLNSIEPGAMARFLLDPHAAETLLAQRLMQSPERTLQDLQALQGQRPTQAAGRPRGGSQVRTSAAKPKGKRPRLSAEQTASLKRQIKTFLARQRWSTRKELTRVVELPTQAIYRRIMQELQDAGEIVSKGEKSKTKYALNARKAKKPAAKKPAPTKPAPTKPAKRAKKR